MSSDADVSVTGAGQTCERALPAHLLPQPRRTIARAIASALRPRCHAAGRCRSDHQLVESPVGIGDREVAVYGSAKAAFIALTRNFAHELGPRGITTFAVCPGIVFTPTLQRFQVREEAVTDALVGAFDRTTIGRFSLADEVARAVAFLASELVATSTGPPPVSAAACRTRVRVSRRWVAGAGIDHGDRRLPRAERSAVVSVTVPPITRES